MGHFDFFGDQQRTIAGAEVLAGEPSACFVEAGRDQRASDKDSLSAHEHASQSSSSAVVLDSGERIVVQDGLIFGRQPTKKPGTNTQAVQLDDTEGLISREHLAVLPRNGELVAIDLGSTNGSTLVRDDRSAELPAHKPVNIQAGDRLILGVRNLTIAG